MKTNKTGKSFLNTTKNSLPFEVIIPGYQLCRLVTQLKKRLARKDIGINSLDSACWEHEIAYSNNTDLKFRHKIDKYWKIVFGKEYIQETT